jgi:hypothetical protein
MQLSFTACHDYENKAIVSLTKGVYEGEKYFDYTVPENDNS